MISIENFNIDDNVIYNVRTYSDDCIILERYDEKNNQKYILEIENCKGVGKDIIQVLSKQYIKRLSEIAQLQK